MKYLRLMHYLILFKKNINQKGRLQLEPAFLFFEMAVIIYYCCFYNLVDWSGRHETPAGLAGQGETPQARMRRGGPPTARAALRAWSGNQQARLTQPFFFFGKITG